MKVKINRTKLYQALKFVSKYSVRNGSTLSVLFDVRVDVNSARKSVTLTCYDLSITAQKTIEAEIECMNEEPEEFSFCIKAKILLNIVSSLKCENIILTAELPIDKLIISCDEAMTVLIETPIHLADDFIFSKTFDVNDDQFSDVTGMLEAVKSVEFCASLDEARPVLMCVEITKDGVVATDAFRVGYLPKPIIGFSGLLPQDALKAARSMIGTDCKIYINQLIVGILKNEDTKIAFYPFEGNFPDYKSIFPKKFALEADLNTRELRGVLNTVVRLEKSNSNCFVKFEFNQEHMEIESSYGFLTDDITYKASLPIDTRVFDEKPVNEKSFNGFPFSIAFNARMLLEYVKTVHEDMITAKFNASNSVAFFTTAGDDAIQYLQMPMHIG